MKRLVVLSLLALALTPWRYGDEDFGGWTPPSTWPTPTPAVLRVAPTADVPRCDLSVWHKETWCPTDQYSDWEYWGTLTDPVKRPCHELEDEQLGRRLPNDQSGPDQYMLKRKYPASGGTVCRYWVRHRR